MKHATRRSKEMLNACLRLFSVAFSVDIDTLLKNRQHVQKSD